MTRTANTLRNVKFAIIGQALGILINLISRKVFVFFLPIEYLGLHGLFSNILSMLTLAELGVGSAIIYSLYRPIAQNNVQEIKSLMQLYQRVYCAVGLFVLIAGGTITPFLHLFVKEMPNIPYIRLIYMIFVANTAVSYFFTYKRSLIIANQKQYIVTSYRYGLLLALNVEQIAALYFTQNFILYLILQTVNTVLENILLSRRADKLFPYLKDKEVLPLRSQVMTEIKKNTGAMVFHRLGGVFVFATDNILISKLVGLVEVGLYSNYMLITQALNAVIGQLFQSVAASFGNLNAQSTDEHKLEIFYVLNFIGAWIFGFCTICLFSLITPFISLWLGGIYLFSIPTVGLIAFVFYMTGMRKAVLTVRDAMGIFWYDRYKPVFEILINLTSSILLGQKFGLEGIITGTIISTLSTCFWIEPYVLYKYGFHAPLRAFFIKYAGYSCVTAFGGLVTYSLCTLVSGDSLVDFILKLGVCLCVPNFIFCICYARTKEFKYLISLSQALIKRKD